MLCHWKSCRVQRWVGADALRVVTVEQNLTERAFDAFVRGDGQRLRRVMSSQYGVDIGCEATDAALAWAWEHWDRLRSMSNPAGYLYRVGQTHARRAVGRGRPVTLPPEPVSITESGRSIDGDLADALRHQATRQSQVQPKRLQPSPSFNSCWVVPPGTPRLSTCRHSTSDQPP